MEDRVKELEASVKSLVEIVENLRRQLEELRAARKQRPLGLKGISNSKSGAAPIAITLYTAKLVETYQRTMGTKYIFDGAKDATAVKKLMASGLEPAVVLERWVYALRERRCGGLFQFALNLNSYVPSKARPVGQAIVEKETDLYGE